MTVEPEMWINTKCSRCETPVRIGVQSLESAEMVRAEPYVCCSCYSKERIAANQAAETRWAA